MESLPSLEMLEFNPDTLEAVRREYNLDQPRRLDEAINILEDWVKKQSHFVKKDFSREYLEITIMTSKGLVERAKTRIEKLCTFKTLMPNFFVYTDVEKTYMDLNKYAVHAHLPKLTDDNYRCYILKILSDDGDSSHIFQYYKYTIMLSEYMKKYDYCNGFVLIADYRDSNIMDFVLKLNVIEFRQYFAILMEGLGMRVKSIHLITPSKMVDALISIIKSVLSEKLAKRIYVHKNVETLYEHVQRDILPAEYGGNEESLTTLQEKWYKTISTKEFQEYLLEMSQAKTEESCRQGDKFMENYLGMPGSFRSLNVD